MSKQDYINVLKETLSNLITEYQDSKLYNDNQEESMNILQDIYHLQDKLSKYTFSGNDNKGD